MTVEAILSPRLLAIATCLAALAGCSDLKPYGIEECGGNDASTFDRIEEEAIQGVARSEAVAALEGDPVVAMELGERFADMNQFDRAEYWYRIAAENDHPQAKQALSILLRERNCTRATFWLESYIEHGADVIGEEQLELGRAALDRYRAECSDQIAKGGV